MLISQIHSALFFPITNNDQKKSTVALLGEGQGGKMLCQKSCTTPVKVTVDFFCQLWWIAKWMRMKRVRPELHTDHRVLSFEQKFALSER